MKRQLSDPTSANSKPSKRQTLDCDTNEDVSDPTGRVLLGLCVPMFQPMRFHWFLTVHTIFCVRVIVVKAHAFTTKPAISGCASPVSTFCSGA